MKKFHRALAIFLTGLLLFSPGSAFAGRFDMNRRGGGGGGKGGSFHGGFHREVVVHRVPPGYVSLLVGGLALLYCEGLFYRHTHQGYTIVQPPVGAVVPVLPSGYTTVFLNGTPYYYYGYTYYTPAPGGYMVVTPPPVAAQVALPAVTPYVPGPVAAAPAPAASVPALAPVPSAAPSQAPAQAPASPAAASQEKNDAFDIYIPNGNGSFTLITLKQTEKGFLGPQGEFYSDHPTIEELKARYVKK